MINKIRFIFITCIALCTIAGVASAQSSDDSVLVELKTVDPELLPYFPRWIVTEPNLQLQVYQTFILDGRDKRNLDMNDIVVTCAPFKDPVNPVYNILLIECGKERMVASEIDAKMRKLSYKISDPKRPYAYRDIPKSTPPSAAVSDAILDYMNTPTNVTHAISASAFEQTLKLGKTDFWLQSVVGTEGSGYTFFAPGEAKVLLRRPLYVNPDPESRPAIPNLINFHIGFGYRLTDTSNGLLSFIPERRLNAGRGGKGVFGFDLHAPFHPQFGVSFHIEVPMASIDSTKTIDMPTYAMYTRTGFDGRDMLIAPLIRTTGYAAVFYNWWVDPEVPENFFRFDLGVNYTDIRETEVIGNPFGNRFLQPNSNNGIGLYHPVEFTDWLYAKIEYRNQKNFPFGISMQYSNNFLLSRVYLPLLGDWLYLDARYAYSTISDERARPFDVSTFMLSPVVRFNF